MSIVLSYYFFSDRYSFFLLHSESVFSANRVRISYVPKSIKRKFFIVLLARDKNSTDIIAKNPDSLSRVFGLNTIVLIPEIVPLLNIYNFVVLANYKIVR